MRSKGQNRQGSRLLSALSSAADFHPFLQDMKAQRVSLQLMAALLFLCSVHARGLRRCLVSMDIRHIEESFQEIKKTIVSRGSG